MKEGLKFPNWVEDYSYWNNVDPPEGISYGAWKMREKIWKEINCGTGRADYNARKLSHDVVSLYGHGSYVSKGGLRSAIFLERRIK